MRRCRHFRAPSTKSPRSPLNRFVNQPRRLLRYLDGFSGEVVHLRDGGLGGFGELERGWGGGGVGDVVGRGEGEGGGEEGGCVDDSAAGSEEGRGGG